MLQHGQPTQLNQEWGLQMFIASKHLMNSPISYNQNLIPSGWQRLPLMFKSMKSKLIAPKMFGSTRTTSSMPTTQHRILLDHQVTEVLQFPMVIAQVQ